MRPHPALTELGGIEHPFLYAPLIETFFRASSDYLIEVDEERGVVRFTHSPTARYVIMARSQHIFGRPDLVLPWGHLRIRYIDGKHHRFAHRDLDANAMFNFINNRASDDGQQYNALTMKYSSNVQGCVFWHRTLLGHDTVTKLRAYQYEVLEQVVAKSTLLEEAHLEEKYAQEEADLNVVSNNWMDD